MDKRGKDICRLGRKVNVFGFRILSNSVNNQNIGYRLGGGLGQQRRNFYTGFRLAESSETRSSDSSERTLPGGQRREWGKSDK